MEQIFPPILNPNFHLKKPFKICCPPFCSVSTTKIKIFQQDGLLREKVYVLPPKGKVSHQQCSCVLDKFHVFVPIVNFPICRDYILIANFPICSVYILIANFPICRDYILIANFPICRDYILIANFPICRDYILIANFPICRDYILIANFPICRDYILIVNFPICRDYILIANFLGMALLPFFLLALLNFRLYTTIKVTQGERLVVLVVKNKRKFPNSLTINFFCSFMIFYLWLFAV